MKPLIACIALLIAGCANVTTGPIPLSADTYMITHTAGAGHVQSAAALKSEVIQEANAFARSQGKVAVAQASRFTPLAPGQEPSFEYQFRLLDKDDPRAQGSVLTARPDIVIENRTAR